ncbi:MAG: efflux RND transporter permease subunit, partial [Leptospiraceae bacterium]|nr:efflux RND transporter permease subunit [Leptospiraceae bacterium]
ELKRQLLEIPELSTVKTIGMPEQEIKVLLNTEKMARNFVSFDEVIQAIKTNKIRASGGSIESFTTKTNIVTFSEFESIEEIENIIIRANFEGNRIYLKDIAKVEKGFKEEDNIVRFNSKKGIGLSIIKKGTADVIRAVEKVEKTLKRFQEEFAPSSLRLVPIFDTSIETKERLEIVYGNAILGFLFVLIVLFLFLDSSTALWTAFGIPVSIAMTLILLPLFDITINSISLCGLVVVIGMVVDDAIIISESIARSRESGLGATEAAIDGLQKVIKPVIGTIITTMLAFVPMYFLPGMLGSFSMEIPSIVILMLAASFLEATFFLPAHLANTNPQKSKVPPGQKFIELLEISYERLLQFSLKRKYLSLFFSLCFLVLGSAIGLWLSNFDMFPIEQSYRIFIYGETAKDSTLEYSEEKTIHLEKVIESLPKGVVHSYLNYTGLDFNRGEGFLPSNNSYTFILNLSPASEREMTARDVQKFIEAKLKEKPDHGLNQVHFLIDGGGPPVGKSIEIRVTGNEKEVRKEILEKIKKDLQEAGVDDIDSDFKDGKKELRILPDYKLIASAGLNVAQIASVIRTAYDGSIVAYKQDAEEKIPFRVSLDKEFLNPNAPLEGLLVRNQQGNLIPIKSLVRVREGVSPLDIFHYNSYRTNTITGNVDKKKTKPIEIYNKIRDKYKDFSKKYPGFSIELGGEAKESYKFIFQMGSAIFISIIAIYFLLVLQFDSYLQPVMVILAIPFGLVGIFLAFGLQRMDISMLALIGILGFTGVIINDSLVMVDYINILIREQKKEELHKDTFLALVIEGAKTRLRPILLTTLTTVVGLIPTAYGIIGGVDYFISPMVMAMAWGLLVGTTSVLFFIPLIYILLIRIK